MSRYTQPSHQVYTSFMHRAGWCVQFLEPNPKTPLPRTLNFHHADKIRELARRGEALGTLEAKQALEAAIEKGRGGVCLLLTPEQYICAGVDFKNRILFNQRVYVPIRLKKEGYQDACLAMRFAFGCWVTRIRAKNASWTTSWNGQHPSSK